MDLLYKTRKMNLILQQNSNYHVGINRVSETLSEVMNANVLIINSHGKVLGFTMQHPFGNKKILDEIQFSEEYTKNLLKINKTTLNLNVNSKCSPFLDKYKWHFQDSFTTIVPIIGGGNRLGTLIVVSFKQPLQVDDVILAENGSTVVGMEIMRQKAEVMEEEIRSKAIVKIAISTLSYSELEAREKVFKEFEGKEILFIASKVANRVGLTPSVIVNALRKLVSAGVIESRSLGAKGTYIKVLNEHLLEEIGMLNKRVG